jgi:hypothetical protein
MAKATFLRVSLRIRDPREAIRFARTMIVAADKLTKAGFASGMRYDQIRSMLSEHFKQVLAERIDQIGEHGRLNLVDRSALTVSIDLAEDAISGKGPLSFTDPDDAAFMRRAMAKFNLAGR